MRSSSRRLPPGSFLETFRLSAAGGATDLRLWTIIRDGLGGLKRQWESNQVSFRVVLVVGVGIVLLQARRLFRRPGETAAFETAFFCLTLAGTIAILSSPGAAGNHLVDLMVAGILLIAVGIDVMVPPSWARLAAPALLIVVALLGMKTNVPVLLERDDGRVEYDAITREISADAVVLAENPSILIHSDKPARVLDTFMLRVIREADPEVSGYFLDELRAGAYDALALFKPADPAAAAYLDEMHFGPGFRDVVSSHYEEQAVIGTTAIYRPREVVRE